jgi:hypothetical protein
LQKLEKRCSSFSDLIIADGFRDAGFAARKLAAILSRMGQSRLPFRKVLVEFLLS